MAWRAGVDRAAAAPENKEVMAELLEKNPKNVPPNVEFYRNAELLKGLQTRRTMDSAMWEGPRLRIFQRIESILIISIM